MTANHDHILPYGDETVHFVGFGVYVAMTPSHPASKKKLASFCQQMYIYVR